MARVNRGRTYFRDLGARSVVAIQGAVDLNSTLSVNGNVTLTGDITVRGGDVNVGVSSTTQGKVTVFGNNTLPGVVIQQPISGVNKQIFTRNNGKVAIATSGVAVTTGYGSTVGAQTA